MLYLPESFQKELINIQTYVKNRLPKNISLSATPSENMHITLKEIADLDQNRHDKIEKYFGNLAQRYKPFSKNDAIWGAKITFSKDGLLKLVLKENSVLTKLAKDIEKKLIDAKNKCEIKELKKRMDFPKHGQITLGQLIKNKKLLRNICQYAGILNDIKSKFRNTIKSNFNVQNFVLLKSNAPRHPRVYDLKGFFDFQL